MVQSPGPVQKHTLAETRSLEHEKQRRRRLHGVRGSVLLVSRPVQLQIDSLAAAAAAAESKVQEEEEEEEACRELGAAGGDWKMWWVP